ncbi:MAG: glycosyltransferase family 4 protein [bacterium]|nr:glycosyltransferase family 4 protein [bacterium]
MKIIVLDEEFPWPLNTGKRIRSFNLLERIASRHELHYLAYGDDRSDSYHALHKAGMNPVSVASGIAPKRGIKFYCRLGLNLFSPEPYIVSSHYSSLYQQALDRLVKEIRPDMIICEWTPYAEFVKNRYDCKKIIVAHNIESTIWQRYYENETNPVKKWYIRKQWKKVLRFETRALKWVDGFTAVSKEEQSELDRLAGEIRSEVIDNGVDLEFFESGNSLPSGKELVFTGSMDWRPNQDAAVYFAQEIYPLLNQLDPEITATFVGRNPPDHVTRLSETEGITITGTVDDVRPYIERAAAYIVPLRIGGGSRLKILEALAMKKGVVSTSIGAEGLEITDGQEIVLADSPSDFVSAIANLLQDRQQAVALGEAGRKLVEKRYGWDSLAERLSRFVLSLVEQK